MPQTIVVHPSHIFVCITYRETRCVFSILYIALLFVYFLLVHTRTFIIVLSNKPDSMLLYDQPLSYQIHSSLTIDFKLDSSTSSNS